MAITIEKLIPSSLKRAVGRAQRRKREAIVGSLPNAPLGQQHVANCQMVLNRAEMLRRLPQGGVVAELGVDRAAFSHQLLEILQPERLHLVDVWESERYNDGLFRQVTDDFNKEIEQGRIQIHRKLSTQAATDFQDDVFDMVYIDTDHTYQTTRDELLKYAPKVKADGILAGHDYSMGNWVGAFRYGVIEAVHEFCIKENWELVYVTADTVEGQSFAIRRIGSQATAAQRLAS
ncbi:MAG: class I SAM-dependent methyltransferase [Pirellulaceae bacterium]